MNIELYTPAGNMPQLATVTTFVYISTLNRCCKDSIKIITIERKDATATINQQTKKSKIILFTQNASTSSSSYPYHSVYRKTLKVMAVKKKEEAGIYN